MDPDIADFRAEDLRPGLAAQFERTITEEDVLTFARLSGDWNPLHVDPAYAGTTNYGRRLAHGALQLALASRLVGVHLPGRRVLLGSVTSRFPAPLYFPCRVRVRGELSSWDGGARSGQVKVQVTDCDSSTLTAEILMGFKMHEERGAATASQVLSAANAEPKSLPKSGAGSVLVTGASGGIGREIVARLAGEFRVLAQTHRNPLAPDLACLPGVSEIKADLADPHCATLLAEAIGPGPLRAVVHAAWPGVPRGGLLQLPTEVLDSQLWFGTHLTVRLARLLFDRVGEEGGAMVAVSSIYASAHPQLATSTYSMGKAGMEHAVRLLAPELALRKITINAVCPSFVAAGLNREADELQKKKEAAQIPLGRLCLPEDVAGVIRFLLSADARFVSGQTIPVSGGRL